MRDQPLFEVTAAAADAAARRLTTAADVQAILFGGAATDTELIETMIDRVSSAAAAYCKLAADAIGTLPTFGRETCRATWRRSLVPRDCELMLPWRVPVVSITSVVEDGVTLSADAFALRPGAILERLVDGEPMRWSRAGIVVTYVTGWDLTEEDEVPPAIEAAVIDQVKAMYLTRSRDATLRAEATESVGSATYSVAGGDSISASGLLLSVEAALDDLRPRTV